MKRENFEELLASVREAGKMRRATEQRYPAGWDEARLVSQAAPIESEHPRASPEGTIGARMEYPKFNALTPAQREELDRRLDEVDAGETEGVPWEEFRARLRDQGPIRIATRREFNRNLTQ